MQEAASFLEGAVLVSCVTETLPTRKKLYPNYFELPLPDLIRSGRGKPNQRKVSSWTFRRGIPEQKFNVNRACFPKTRIHKNGRNSWTFRFGPFFGLVCRGDSWFEFCQTTMFKLPLPDLSFVKEWFFKLPDAYCICVSCVTLPT